MDENRILVTGNGETLLMIHGIISDASFFEEISAKLSNDYRVISYDRTGYGTSERGEASDYSVGAQAEYAAQVIRKVSPDSGVWVFGNSAGSLIAIELCFRYPELVKGMLLLEPSLPFGDYERELMRSWNQELNSYVEEKRIKKALSAFIRVTKTQGEVVHKPVSIQKMKQTFINLENFMYGELNEVQRYYPTVESLKGIDKPIRIVITELGKDGIFGISSRSAAKAIGWKVASFPGGHNTIQDFPEECASCIKKVIDEMKNE